LGSGFDYMMFQSCEALTSVTFNNNNVNLLTLPQKTFYGCILLKSIELPTSVTTIGVKRLFE